MVLAPAPPRDRRAGRPPGEPPPSKRPAAVPARRAIAIGLAALVLAGLLEAEALDSTARAQPFGWRRTAAVALVGPLVRTSRALGLDHPRRWLDDAIHREEAAPPPTPTPVPTSPSPEPSPTVTPPARRIPTPASPLRIWIGGDSMAQVFGEAVTRAASRTGVAKARLEVRYSTGLTRPDFYDWPARMRALLRGPSAPEAIVVMVGANDAQGIVTPGGAARFGTAAWRAEYRSRVAAVMDLLTDPARTVYWVGQPIARDPGYSSRMRILNEIYRSEAAKRGVRYIDSWSAFTDANGKYSAYLPASDGHPVLMRAPDGIHFTRAGGERLARIVFAAIRQDWELTPR